MNVLMLTQSIDSYRPGPDGFIVDWVRALAKRADRLVVLAYHYNPKEKLPSNTLVIKITGKNVLSRNFDLLKKIIIVGQKESIDVIFAHILEIFGIAAAVGGKVIGAKSFLWYCQIYNLRQNTLAKLALSLVDRVFTCSKEFKNQYVSQVGKTIRKKIIVVGHGIDTARFITKTKISFPGVGQPVKIAYAGRLSPVKDIFTMLTAVEKLRKADSKVTFHLYGSWGIVDRQGKKFQAALSARIKRINLAGKLVYFPRPKAYSYCKSPQVFKSADIFIMPGLKTLAEILSCGVTTVYPKSYTKFLKRDFPQLTYKFGDAEDLAKKLSWLIENPKEAMKVTRLASTSIKEVFSLDTLMKKIYDKLQSAYV